MSDLTEVFRSLGATDPERWSASQKEEGIPQLHRFLFLRAAWEGAVKSGDHHWIDAMLAARKSPFEQATAEATLRVLESGADREDLNIIVRQMQADFLFHLCAQIDCPDPVDILGSPVLWGLFALSEQEEPTTPIVGLHESVLETNPAGVSRP